METAIPMVTVLMPTYNRAKLLARAIASVRSQSFDDWELVVVNDASTDGTSDFLDGLARRDPRVRPVHVAVNNYPDISKTLNDGMAVAQGAYIARLDDDDYWCDDDKLKKQVAHLDAHPACVIAGGGTIVIDDHDNERFRYQKPESDAAIRDAALLANPFTHSTVMFRRDAAWEAGGYGNFKNTEDWDLWLRMGRRGTFYNFPDYFVRYLLTEKSKTFIFKRSQSREILRIVTAHRREYPHFAKAWVIGAAQYLYGFLPVAVQRSFHQSLSKLKRGIAGK
jgi:glycosyltransferase involved in cell wall biosynthesis